MWRYQRFVCSGTLARTPAPQPPQQLQYGYDPQHQQQQASCETESEKRTWHRYDNDHGDDKKEGEAIPNTGEKKQDQGQIRSLSGVQCDRGCQRAKKRDGSQSCESRGRRISQKGRDNEREGGQKEEWLMIRELLPKPDSMLIVTIYCAS